ncbi:hypothetical protein AAC387_Pa04g2769 [Persea americana]
MNAVGRFITQSVYTVSGPFHPFGGAVDIIVVEQQDGSFKCSPWYVKFGKFQGVLKTREKIVNVSVNGVEAGFHMYLNHKGEAYFLKEADGGEENSDFLSLSSGNKTDEQPQNGRMKKAESLNLDDARSNQATYVNMSNEKIVVRTNSRRSRIFGLMFGQKSVKDGDRIRKGNISMERISSLERAEIAADLLEMKWSTNLPTKNWKLKNASSSKPSASETAVVEVNKVVEVSVEEVSQNVKVSVIEAPEVVTRDSDDIWCLKSHEKVLALPTSEASDSADSHEIISELSAVEINEVGEENAGSDVIARQSALQTSSPDLEEASSVHSSDFAHSNTGQVSDRGDFHIKHYGFGEECEERRVSSNIYSGMPRRSSVAVDVYSGDVDTHTLDFSSREYTEVGFSSGVSYEASILISEVNSEPEYGAPMSRKNSNGCKDSGLSRSNDSCCHDSNASTASKAISENSLVKNIVGAPSMDDVGQAITESHPSIDRYLPSSSSVEVKMVEVAQDAIVERFPPERTSEMVATFENQSATFENRSQIISPTCPVCGSEAINVEACTELTFSFQMDEDDRTYDSVEETQSRCTCTHFGDSINQVQEVENPEEEVKTCELYLSSEIIIGPQKDTLISPAAELVNSSMQSPDSLEDDQFPISDIDNFGLFSSDEVRIGNHPVEDTREEHVSNDMRHETSMSKSQSFGSCSFSTTSSNPEEFVQESSPNAIQVLPKEIRTQSSPICIPRGQMHSGDGIQSVGSLPNIRSHIHDFGWSDVQQPLSRSLDVSSGSPNWDILGNGFSSTSKSKATFQNSIVQDNSAADVSAAAVDALGTMEHEVMSTGPAVEMSLCKHLLFKGMGAEAASQAFDAEKIDLEKFRGLCPSIVKNERLIVRIARRYFPWDAAAPIILGMFSFGREFVFKPEGMIAVDQEEKIPNSELLATVVPPGGGWRFWPFPSKKMKTVNSARSPLDATKGMDANNASESFQSKSMNKTTAMKKKVVRSIVPTSEQLASLNLKDGQNVITFTFSTAMLGRQQVDASVYLWKWNTRIVVSDVDGTITKSDVLGQFMPLVGKDWSQTGVARLFSAIKENGYQLLFLSARAISQAYLTRQFLFNLKQDGKGLPEGPVVISPDGLFPSLFREVIRRAPHEFKISCLEGIRALFPLDCNPFYAGFGNRDTDEISYLKVGIPKSKIFIINPKGEVVVNRRVNTKSYTSLHELVNGMFPPTMSTEQEDFNSWNYWKMPLPEINI